MKPFQKQYKAPQQKKWIRILVYIICTGVFFSTVIVGFFIFEAKQSAWHQTSNMQQVSEVVVEGEVNTQFPVGVNLAREEIIENPMVESYFNTHVSNEGTLSSIKTSWIRQALGRLALMNWYQNLASLSSRILVIQSGERKEQVAQNMKKILGWSNEEEKIFLNYIEGSVPKIADGKFFPGTYTVARGAKPEEVARLILDRFDVEVLARYGDAVEAQVPLTDTLTIASLIEREAYDFVDMRLISGVIWNRLFTDMRLQIDATLQYAKGSKPSQPWWPKVNPSDKYIASVYNTYKNTGLPPAPIANPSLEAIIAALNPKKTDCMYYFHDSNSGFHCTQTYEEHIALLKQYYGRGR